MAPGHGPAGRPFAVVRTPDQASRLHAANRAVLRRIAPEAARLIERVTPAGRLVFDAAGEPDLEVHGRRLYGEGARSHTARQVEAYLAAPTRFEQPPPAPDPKDPHAAAFIEALLRRCTGTGIAFHGVDPSCRAYQLVVMGLGLGAHLERLVHDTDSQALILVETHPEFLYHSTFTLDWGALVEHFERLGTVPRIVIGEDPALLAEQVRQAARNANPAALERLYVYRHTAHPVLTEAMRRMEHDRHLFSAGLGFFADERFMIAHTYRNLSPGAARLFRCTPERRVPVPALLVGGGPSKDAHYDHIRRLAEGAVVFSCGGALDPLLAAGIRPDFHVLIERDTVWADWLEETAAAHDLSGITFVGSTTVDPRIPAFFERSVLFFRRGLSPAGLFGLEDSSLSHCDPEVVNGALDVAQQAGFRDFFLFGVDLGCRDPAYHHSKGSHALRKNTLDKALDRTAPGNFGGEVLTHHVWHWVRVDLERAIRRLGPHRRYLNCSDGAYIEGAVPTRAERIDSAPVPGGKAALVDALIAGFPPMTGDHFKRVWAGADQRRAARHIADGVLAALAARDARCGQAWITRLVRVLVGRPVPLLSTAMVMRGSLFVALNALLYYEGRVRETDGARDSFHRIATDEMGRLVERIHDDFVSLLDALESGRPGL